MKKNFLERKYLFTLILICTGIMLVFPQKISWEKTYGGFHADYLYDIQPTPDYGFILAGSSASDIGGSKDSKKAGVLDYWIWKMSETGKLEWQRSYGGDGIDMLNSIVITRDGGILLGGTSNSQKGFDKTDNGFGNDDYWVLKLDPFGVIQWQKTFGGKGQERLSKVIQTSDGGFLLGGSSSSNKVYDFKNQTVIKNGKSENSRGNLDYWIIKLDTAGDEEWQRTFGGIYVDELKSIAETHDNGYLLGGYSNSPQSGDKTDDNFGFYDYWILKVDKTGDLKWQKTIGGEGEDHNQSVIETSDKGFLVTGHSNSPISHSKQVSNNNNSTDIWVLKFDEYGDEKWQKTYHIEDLTILTSTLESNDNNYILGGYSQRSMMEKMTKGTVSSNYFTIKIDQEGELLWKKEIGSSSRDILAKIVETRDGGYVLAGTSDGNVSKSKQSKSIGLEDFWVVKLLDEDKDENAKRMIEAYPNPTNNFTNVLIGFEFDTGTATMYDIAGRQLQHFEIKSRTVPVSLQGLPLGVYLITIHTNNGSETVKILKGN
ncbi:MAG: T9SS type A sorting domain-containing protein [Flavobacteriales bacterium]|nr:T9SS type A sorting domain-containing protein [Flavobacteriales bacterium]